MNWLDVKNSVNEWIWDWGVTTVTDTTPVTGPASGSQRGKRGGGWDTVGSSSNGYVSRNNSKSYPYEKGGNNTADAQGNRDWFGFGFRVVRTVK